MIPVRRVLAPNPGPYTLEGTNTWVVGSAPCLVIDPGPPDQEHLREVARTAGGVAQVLLTHDHEDHAEGAAAFAAMVGAPLRAVRVPGARPLVDGDAVCSGAACLRVVATPGHSADHVAFFLEEDRALFTGDAVVGRGTSFIDPPDGDLAVYLDSLERMAALGPRTIYPGHGPVVFDAAGTLRWYREHRLERERQVLELLGGEELEGSEGPDHAVDDLVAAIYVGYPPDVLPLAARSVTAHLLKLEAEGRVRREGHGIAQRWALASPKACARCGRSMTGAGRYCQRCLVTMLQGAGTAEPSRTDQP